MRLRQKKIETGFRWLGNFRDAFFLRDFSQHIFFVEKYSDCSRCSCMRAYMSSDVASINGTRDEDDEERKKTGKSVNVRTRLWKEQSFCLGLQHFSDVPCRASNSGTRTYDTQGAYALAIFELSLFVARNYYVFVWSFRFRR